MPDAQGAAIVLAAGASRRLGEPKQLVRIDGETLIHRTARLAVEASCAPVLVVIGFEAERMRCELADGNFHLIENPEWREGMGSSLRAGIRAAAALEPPPTAALLLVCDQSRLTAVHLRHLLAQHRSSPSLLTASHYGGRPGVPAVFSPTLFPDLLEVRGDRGARDVIARHAEQTRIVLWEDGAFDLDRPADRLLLPQEHARSTRGV